MCTALSQKTSGKWSSILFLVAAYSSSSTFIAIASPSKQKGRRKKQKGNSPCSKKAECHLHHLGNQLRTLMMLPLRFLPPSTVEGTAYRHPGI
jgi:hypothetical protein